MTDFSSIDRLMELGLGMGLAQQMMRTMNEIIANTSIPGTGNTLVGLPAGMKYFAVVENAQVGPLTDGDIANLVRCNLLTDCSLLWRPGMKGWQQARDIPEVYKIILLNNGTRG